ncbi:glycosyltransferase family 2 protein [Hymenobacter endophyticus]|uniref:Glycosyltransferase family 2 protein n=1 Tax=Hymenobacter endophyticus TaxID=3076335 RepID=A0ABU3TG85_9BACT|nr:glycosyltransferase family 2 protein [Hymenobacter endophyticus]MDU0370355.1 glycosyltransferase family 2 protein [Hymenobacter endophyticus]
MPTSASPLVSVIIPVFNAGEYLRPAIDSILQQTFQDFELIIVDDCSRDESLAVARSYEADPRVKVLANAQNRGRSFSDNYGAEFARGKYIAKMDADDVALPHRLQTQIGFLEQNPSVGLTSSFMKCFGESDIVYEYPVSADAVRSYMLFNMPVANPTAFFRRSLLQEHGLRYDDTIQDTFGEDYEFIARVAQVVDIVNQPEILLHYRTLPQILKADVHARRNAKSNQIRERQLRVFGIPFTERELLVHNTISYVPFTLGDITLAEVHAWLWKINAFNQERRYADPAAMLRCVAERWFLTCYLNPDKRTNSLREFRRQPLARHYQPTARLQGKFLLKSYVLRHF